MFPIFHFLKKGTTHQALFSFLTPKKALPASHLKSFQKKALPAGYFSVLKKKGLPASHFSVFKKALPASSSLIMTAGVDNSYLFMVFAMNFFEFIFYMHFYL